MHHIKRTRFSTKSRWSSVMKSCNGLCEYMPRKCVSDVGVAGISSTATERIAVNDFAKRVRVRIGSPATGYGQESRNRAAHQQFPNRIWTDEDGIEHVEVNFYVRRPHGTGRVYTEMFKDKVDKQWQFTYLIVDVKSPSPAKLMLESYVPA